MQSTKVFLIKSTDVFPIKNTIVFLIKSTKVFLLQSTTEFPSRHKIYLLKSIFAFKLFQKCEKGVELLMQSTKVFACGAHTTSAKTLTAHSTSQP